MPATKKAAPKTETPKTETVALPGKKKETRPVLFPRFEAMFCCAVPEDHYNVDADGNRTDEPVQYDDPITVERAKELLGWMTEEEYKIRKLDPNYVFADGTRGNPLFKGKALEFGEEYTLKDSQGRKVRCFNNSSNRPFNAEWCKNLSQDILTLQWWMNCESIILGRTGIVQSGQHRLIGLVLAGEQYELQGPGGKWAVLSGGKEPVLESLVVFGNSEDPRVLNTLDSTRPRSPADVFYTSPLFAVGPNNKEYSSSARQRLTEMLAKAIKLLWRRMKATNEYVQKMTNSAAYDFSERHPKLQAAIKHIHTEMGSEGGNVFQSMKLNSGACAALLYLMGQSDTPEAKVAKYRKEEEAASDRNLEWKRWDKALEFWSEMAKNPSAEEADDRPPQWVMDVREALVALDGDSGRGGTPRQRHAIVANAWHNFLEGKPRMNKLKIGKNSLGEDVTTWHELWPKLEFDENRNRRIIPSGEEPTFGGADLGEQWEDEGDDDKDDKKAEPVLKANPDKKVIPTPTPVTPAPKSLSEKLKEKTEEPPAAKPPVVKPSAVKPKKAVLPAATAALKGGAGDSESEAF